jgi:hypothetical protein
VTAATFALLIVDSFDDGAIWNYGVILCISKGGSYELSAAHRAE